MPRKPNTYGVKKRGERWTALPYIPGRSKKVYAGTFDTEAEATKAALAKIESERRLPANRETVGTFVNRWLKDFPRTKESTNDRYRADSKRFAKEYGSRRLDEIDKPTARSWAQAHPHDHAALRAMYGDAMRDGLVLANPFSELRISKGRGRRDIVPITSEELDRIAALALKVHGDYGVTFRSIVLFGAYVGLRPGEMFGLDVGDVDYGEETVRIRCQFHKRRLTLPKSGKKRTVFLPAPATAALRAMPSRVPRPLCRYTGTPMLFPGKLGQRITQSALSNYWRPVRTAFEATLSESRLMDFERASGSLDFYAVTRHHCATRLVEKGVEYWVVAKQLGHETSRLVEDTYSHPRDEIARERLRRAFSEPTKLEVVKDREAANG